MLDSLSLDKRRDTWGALNSLGSQGGLVHIVWTGPPIFSGITGKESVITMTGDQETTYEEEPDEEETTADVSEGGEAEEIGNTGEIAAVDVPSAPSASTSPVEQDGTSPRPADAQIAAQGASPMAGAKEDPFDFDESTVEIALTLHPRRGHSDGRLVTICVHNHHGTPVYRSFRERELTEQSPLDRLQKGIAQAVHAFRGELSARKQDQWEQEQERKQAKQKQRQKASSTTVPPAPHTGTVQQAAASTKPATPNDGGAPSPSQPAPSRTPTTGASSTPATTATTKQKENGLTQATLF